MRKYRLSLTIGLLWLFTQGKTVALPPPEDIPEEVLRSEIILEGRSPIDNQPLTSGEYTQLVQGFRERQNAQSLNPRIKSLIFDLTVLRLLRTIIFF